MVMDDGRRLPMAKVSRQRHKLELSELSERLHAAIAAENYEAAAALRDELRQKETANG